MVSPILLLKEKGTKKPSESMRNALFENIVENQNSIQTIVLKMKFLISILKVLKSSVSQEI